MFDDCAEIDIFYRNEDTEPSLFYRHNARCTAKMHWNRLFSFKIDWLKEFSLNDSYGYFNIPLSGLRLQHLLVIPFITGNKIPSTGNKYSGFLLSELWNSENRCKTFHYRRYFFCSCGINQLDPKTLRLNVSLTVKKRLTSKI